jgi:formylmethanofuran dehydrogenase subunit E
MPTDKPESLIACDGCKNMYTLIEIAILGEETLCGMCFHIRQRNEEQKQ